MNGSETGVGPAALGNLTAALWVLGLDDNQLMSTGEVQAPLWPFAVL
jgi:hypothetical protein